MHHPGKRVCDRLDILNALHDGKHLDGVQGVIEKMRVDLHGKHRDLGGALFRFGAADVRDQGADARQHGADALIQNADLVLPGDTDRKLQRLIAGLLHRARQPP